MVQYLKKLYKNKIGPQRGKSFKLNFMDDSKNMVWKTHFQDNDDDDDDDGGLELSSFSISLISLRRFTLEQGSQIRGMPNVFFIRPTRSSQSDEKVICFDICDHFIEANI